MKVTFSPLKRSRKKTPLKKGRLELQLMISLKAPGPKVSVQNPYPANRYKNGPGTHWILYGFTMIYVYIYRFTMI